MSICPFLVGFKHIMLKGLKNDDDPKTSRVTSVLGKGTYFLVIPPGKDRWLNSHVLVKIISPYKSTPFGSCAIDPFQMVYILVFF